MLATQNPTSTMALFAPRPGRSFLIRIRLGYRVEKRSPTLDLHGPGTPSEPPQLVTMCTSCRAGGRARGYVATDQRYSSPLVTAPGITRNLPGRHPRGSSHSIAHPSARGAGRPRLRRAGRRQGDGVRLLAHRICEPSSRIRNIESMASRRDRGPVRFRCLRARGNVFARPLAGGLLP